MALFSRNSGVQSQAGTCEVICDSAGRTGLAFGVSWRSMVTKPSEADAVKLARDARATHYLFLSRQVGFARLPAGVLQASDAPVVVAAAYLVGRHYGGNALFALCLDESAGEYWFAEVRNGAPTSTDLVIKSLRVPDARARVETMSAALRDQDVRFEVYSNIDVLDARPCSPEEVLRLMQGRAGALTPLPKRPLSIPRPVLVAAAGVAVVAAGSQLWGLAGRWIDRIRPKPLAIIEPTDDHAALWRNAFRSWLATQVGPTQAGLARARSELGAAPAEIEGWRLQAAGCKALPMDAGKRQRGWACLARYQRHAGAALTREVLPGLPKKWSIALAPLNEMTASWSFIEADLPALDLTTVRSVREHQVATASELQRVAPGMAKDPTLVFTAAAVEPPKGRDGKPVQAQYAPPESQNLASGSLHLKGPLRTVDYVISRSSIEADWSSLSLVLERPTETNARTSRLQAEIAGVIYAKN